MGQLLLEAAWGGEDKVSGNSVDVYVGYLRRKLAELSEDIRIETVRGSGYRLEVTERRRTARAPAAGRHAA